MGSSMNTRVGPIIGANTGRVGVVTGDHATILASTSATDVLKGTGGVTGAGKGFLHSLIVKAAGTGWQLDFYDDPSTTNNKLFTWVTADSPVGVKTFALQIPLQQGLVVVSNGGTAGDVTIVWS